MPKLTPPTDAEITALRRIARVMQVFRDVDSSFPASYAYCFLYVAMHPNATVSDVSEACGIQRPTASRILLELGKRSRQGGPGFGLLEADRANEDLRQVNHWLTPEGKKLMARVIKANTEA